MKNIVSPKDKIYYEVIDALEEGISPSDALESVRDAIREWQMQQNSKVGD